MIQLQNVTKRIKENTVLDNVSYTFKSGFVYGLYGQNGSGKTMLLRAISGLINLDSGSIFIDGEKLHDKIEFPPETGIVIENMELLPECSAKRNLQMLAKIKNIADERNFPIFQTEMITGVVSSELMNTLEEKLARETLMHGVFLNIHGKGVIIKGDSGIGKSEIALELVKRGHLLVADDAVELYRIGQKIVGKAPAVLANLLEIRGIGVIDVSKMFGISAILDRNDVDLVIQLERWVPSREYTRVGVEENDISEDVLGIKIPKIVVPVSSGRSMSVIIEAAVMNMRLRDVGIDSSKEFVERILKNIDHNKQES